MGFALSARAAAAGYRLRSFDSIGSTNAEALALAREGEVGPLWLVSKHQRTGRGRRGRAWATPPGNLAATLLLDLDLPPARAATIGFVAGLAVRAALTRIAPAPTFRAACDGAQGLAGTRFELKWPNDLIADGAKCAGILLESEALPSGVRVIAVGVGINIVASPKDVPYPATSLAELGCEATAEEVFEALSESWIDMAALWDFARGMNAIRELWLRDATGLGRPVSVRLGEEVLRGVFETIDEAGQLVIRASDGSRRTIAAGDVHFGVAASAPVEA